MKTHALITTREALRQRCIVDAVSGCWNWQGGCSSDGVPRLHAFDPDVGDKRTMSGPRAAWCIAHGKSPLPGWYVMRSCGSRLCLNPVHLRESPNRKEMGQHIRRAGWRKGTHLEQRRASQRLAMAASGVEPTPEHIVLAIRAADRSVTATALAREHGIAVQTASRIRRGQSHRHLLPPSPQGAQP